MADLPAPHAGDVTPFPVLIVGTGALATLFAARLAQQGHPVTLLGSWREGIAALQAHGARVLEPDGREIQVPVRATDRPEQVPRHRYALILVKAWQTEAAIARLQPTLAEDGLALTLQNGLGHQERLREALGADRVAVGVTMAGATLLAPGRVRAAGGEEIVVERHPRLPSLVQALQRAGFRVRVVDDARSALWGKLLINVAVNPFGALLGKTNGELLQDATALCFMEKAVQEVMQVVNALGVPLPYDDPMAEVRRVLAATAANRNSMLQDLSQGRPTEIDALCGAVVREAQRLGLTAPMNQALWEMVRSRERGQNSHETLIP